MKRIFCILFTVCCFLGCTRQERATMVTPSSVTQGEALTPEEEVERRIYALRRMYERKGANKDSLRRVYNDYLREVSIQHQGDSLGLMIVKTMAEDFNSLQLDSVMSLSDLYRQDSSLQALYNISVAAEATAVGRKFKDFEGRHPKTDEVLRLSSFVGHGKPVLLNFWSSSNMSSRSMIRNEIFDCANRYRNQINVVSVAVWEDSVTFVNRAISELEVTWPVIYSEGRVGNPADLYGISGVPHVMLIGRDGVVKARNLQKNEIKEAIEKELKR